MNRIYKLFHKHKLSPMTVDLTQWACVECFEKVNPTLEEYLKIKDLLNNQRKMLEEDLQKQLKQSGYMGEFDLSSLVEACGVMELLVYINYAQARADGKESEGVTPEEAVAMLWLALQENK